MQKNKPVFFCDGSQSKELMKLGIGIVSKRLEAYCEIEEFRWCEQLHEVYAISKTIEIAKETIKGPFVVINDDRNLVTVLTKYRKNKYRFNSDIRRWVAKKPEREMLLDLIKINDVHIRVPNGPEEKKKVKKAHDLSRSYISVS